MTQSKGSDLSTPGQAASDCNTVEASAECILSEGTASTGKNIYGTHLACQETFSASGTDATKQCSNGRYDTLIVITGTGESVTTL